MQLLERPMARVNIELSECTIPQNALGMRPSTVVLPHQAHFAASHSPQCTPRGDQESQCFQKKKVVLPTIVILVAIATIFCSFQGVGAHVLQK